MMETLSGCSAEGIKNCTEGMPDSQRTLRRTVILSELLATVVGTESKFSECPFQEELNMD